MAHDLSDNKNPLHDRILKTPAGSELSRCIACGTCSSGCPVHARRKDFDPRKLVRMILMGLEQELMDDGTIWLCSTCYTCLERCPQKVGCAEIITELRNLAASEGKAPEAYRMQMEALRKYGRVYEIEEFDNKKRGKMGLAVLNTEADLKTLLVEREDGEEKP
jgi:heterodisulfide reductase subunit C